MPRTGEFSWIDHSSRSEFEKRWHDLQADFIEDPRRAVSHAGVLMADLMEHVGKNLRSRRELDSKSGEPDTEAMRLEMHRYKSLMHQMFHGGTPATPSPQAARTEPVAQRPAPEQPRPQPKTSD